MGIEDDTRKNLQQLKRLLGSTTVLKGERPEAYDELLTKLAESLQPKDFLGWLLTKEAADQTWEINRLQEYKRKMVETRRRALARMEAKRTLVANKKVETDDLSGLNASTEQKRIFELEEAIEGTVDRVDEILSEGQREWAEALAFEQKLSVYEIADRLQAGKIVQRNVTIEQMEMHKEILEQRERRKPTETIIEGECAEVPPEETKIVPSDEEQKP